MTKYSEDSFIADLARRFPAKRGRGARVVKSIGDDTSVTTQRPGALLLSTTDTLVEGVHFKRAYTTARELGRKAVNVSVSDIAAMGGTPLFLLVSLGVPGWCDKKFLDELYRGIADASESSGVVLAGGNTVGMPGRFFISTTMTGEVAEKKVVYRSGARPGDLIYLTGTAGDAALGLKSLKTEGRAALKGPYRLAARRHLDPAPRLDAGRELAGKRLATAMIDVSDGVMLDLARLAEESSAGALIECAKVPVSPAMRRFAAGRGRASSATRMQLAGGEDYELLFTARPENANLISDLSEKLGLAMTPVGTIIEKPQGVRALDKNGRPVRLATKGFEHF